MTFLYKNTWAVFLLSAILFFGACDDPNEGLYDELDKTDTGYRGSLTISLTTDSYSEIADLIKKKYPEDSLAANFIEANNFFNDSVSASNFVPLILNDKYLAYGIGSNALVTFNYNGDVPENLEQYTNANSVELVDSNYTTVSFTVGKTKYFTPDYPADIYLSDILNQITSNPHSGDLVLVSYKESSVNPIIDTSLSTIFNKTFDTDLDNLTTFSATGDDQVWGWANYGEPPGCAKMSGYQSGNIENEDWLISSAIDLSSVSNPVLTFEEAIKYENDSVEDNQIILISTDYLGSGNPSSATWAKLSVTGRSTGDSWNFVEIDPIDLSAYTGQSSVYIAFKYLSTATNAATWEIDNIKITSGKNDPITGKEPVTTKTIYQYQDNKWKIVKDVYYLNSYDYDRMGDPGNYDNFSTSALPKDYLPNFMNYKYPSSGEGVTKTLIYRFYNGEGTVTLATEMTFEDGSWKSSYNYIESITQQFLVSTSRGKWVFDPTVSFEMTSSDYQTIVDNRESKYIDSYGTAEFYSGASAYYSNFDLRISKRKEYNPNDFNNLSDDEAKKLIIKRLVDALQVLLKNKYPDAKTEINGIDVYYKATFESYNNDFSSSTWEANMQCIKNGPNPEFELVNNTFIRDKQSVLVE